MSILYLLMVGYKTSARIKSVHYSPEKLFKIVDSIHYSLIMPCILYVEITNYGLS